MQSSAREQIKLSNMTLSFVTPSLKPSKDFPPPRLIDEIDLSQVVKPKILFHGYWDGPRHQVFSVTGTLRIWLDVRPWPTDLKEIRGCDAKAKAYVNQKFLAEVASYKQGEYPREPKMDISKLSIAGRNSLRYRSNYDHIAVHYVVPINDKFLLNLIFESADNSKYLAGWPELSEREQERFLRSLELSSDAGGCH